ncbi:OLC1v1035552C1 [Oldenlandia corymbosa var. corymbosa]|uniref:OLC1v1035552C1 n=1 Tax=Oldenlandia corymbosa var. corymbosa TaxID=529605 RepID=A0AAV1CWL7_OLDCO|nr:OLC1v1035552C1 [Oldenlandia corymbosa var. corymbosa]
MDKDNQQKEGNRGKAPTGSMGRQDFSSNYPPVNQDQNVYNNPSEVHPGGSLIDDDDGGYDSQGNLKRRREEAVCDDSSAGSKKSMLSIAVDWENTAGSKYIRGLARRLGLLDDGSKIRPISHPGDSSSSQILPVSQSTDIRSSNDPLVDNLRREKGKMPVEMSTDSGQFTEAQKDELQEAFSSFDKDGDGSITPDELGSLMRLFGLNPSEAEVGDMLQKVSTARKERLAAFNIHDVSPDDQSVKIDFMEFLELMKQKTTDLEFEFFNQIDEDRDGYISTDQLMRALVEIQIPIVAEVQGMMNQVNSELGGKIGFNEFVKLLDQIFEITASEEELIKSFEEFDKGKKGFISAADLRHVMTTYGDTLTDEEADEMIKEADPDDTGIIDYKEFVNKMCGKQ